MNIPENNDELVIGLQNDEQEAFNALYYKYHQQVFRNICKLINRRESAQDILQEVFLALWENRSKLDPAKSAAGWLFVVSYNKSITFLKNELREAREIINASRLSIGEEDTSLAELFHSEQWKNLVNLVEKLPSRKKQAFRLCKFEGKSYQEAGYILGISDVTVKEYVKSCNKLIRRYMDPESCSLLLFMAVNALFLTGG